MGRLGRLGLEGPVRYERTRLGELGHLDVKKVGRIEVIRAAQPSLDRTAILLRPFGRSG